MVSHSAADTEANTNLDSTIRGSARSRKLRTFSVDRLTWWACGPVDSKPWDSFDAQMAEPMQSQSPTQICWATRSLWRFTAPHIRNGVGCTPI